jgi:ribonuclease HI
MQKWFGQSTVMKHGVTQAQAPRQSLHHLPESNTDTSQLCTQVIQVHKQHRRYEAVILGLRKLRALGVITCIIKTDSKVVASQIEKDYSAKGPVLMQYLAAIRILEKQFKGFILQHIERNKNEEADTLAKAAAKGEPLPSDVFYQVVGTPAVRNHKGLQITQDTDGHRIVNLIMAKDWRAPITLYLQGHYHPSDHNEAKRLKHRSRDFSIVNG